MSGTCNTCLHRDDMTEKCAACVDEPSGLTNYEPSPSRKEMRGLLDAALERARREALEEAAKVADIYAETAEKYESDLMRARANESRTVAAAIRALKNGRQG